MELDSLPQIELDALKLILEGDDTVRANLRIQLDSVASIQRQETGAGVYVEFMPDASVIALDGKVDLVLSDVFADTPNGDTIGFMLFVSNGVLSLMEAYCHAGDYPSYSGWTPQLYHEKSSRTTCAGLQS